MAFSFPKEYTIPLYQGDTRTIEFRHGTAVNGVRTYTDFTGYTGIAEVKESETSDPVLTLSTTNSKLTLGSDGWVRLIISDDDALLLSGATTYSTGVKVISPGGNTYTLMRFKFPVTARITTGAP